MIFCVKFYIWELVVSFDGRLYIIFEDFCGGGYGIGGVEYFKGFFCGVFW